MTALRRDATASEHQPVSVAALLVGAHLGAKRGVAFAILVTLLSTCSSAMVGGPFPSLGLVDRCCIGAKANLIEDGELNHRRLYLLAALVAPLFGVIATLSLVSSSMTASQFMMLVWQGLPFDAVHALGNVAFAVWTGSMIHASSAD